MSLPTHAAVGSTIAPIGWIASPAALQELPTEFEPRYWTFDEFASAYIAWRKRVQILSAQLPRQEHDPGPAALYNPNALRADAKVLVIIPNYRCEEWLDECLWSIVNQTRPAEGIVVVDDGSPEPPVDIVRRYPEVTLLATTANVGPYRIDQAVIDSTRYDAYMFQDADDWSMHDRLENLLLAAEHTSADLVGSQEMRVFADRAPDAQVVAYPLDVSQALAHRPAHVLQHPTSLVSRRLVMATGGYASGLRFGGDTEFLLRARFKGRLVNTETVSYVRCIRPDSLTGSPDTGFRSIARQRLLHDLKVREAYFADLLRNGRLPDLAPMAVGEPARLRHILGPSLMT
jgi:glycosyltransferase involved in cell wall biosynthesis